MNSELKPEDVLPFIRSEFEDFDSIVDLDDGIYGGLGDFAIYLRNEMNGESLSEEKCQKAFKIMNAMGASKDLEVQNLLVVGILEILTDKDKVVSLVRSGLNGQAAEIFEKVLNGWVDL
ncbi:MAG: hypothetical protein ABJL73_08510 [Lentilitoribacter sp.]